VHHQWVRHLHVPRRDRSAHLPHLRQPAAARRVLRARTLTGNETPRRPAVRRDADGGYRIDTTWESLTERLIREAQELGAFEGLPGRGRRLDPDDDPREGEMGLAFHILRTNDTVPPWIAADREARRSVEALERLLGDAAAIGRAGRVSPTTRARLRSRMERAIRDNARAVEALNLSAPSMSLHRRPLDPNRAQARLEHALDGRVGDETSE
jgi:hypothetical protein